MEKEMTPKEKFDAEMKSINATLSKDAPEKQAGFSDEEVEELEEEVEAINEAIEESETVIDKSMGETKVEVTKEQFNSMKQEQEKMKILHQLSQAGGLKAEKLSPEQEAKMQKLFKLERDGKLADPVLKHLLSKKVKIAQDKVKLDIQAKEMQMKLVLEFKKLADATMKCVGATNTFNASILEYVEENPGVLDEGNS